MESTPEYSSTDEREIHDSDDDYDTETVTKTCECHSDNLLASHRKRKNDGELCDVTIKSGAIEIKAHRFVLASATDYFKAMFQNETKEAETGIVNFPKMLPEVVKQCIEFAYSGQVEISMKIARDLLDASEMMQLPELSKLCVEYLAEQVDMSNCAEVISLCYLYSKDSLHEQLRSFLRHHFKEFTETDEFTCFTFETLKHCYRLLGKGSGDCEKNKWSGILKWIERDEEERKCHFPELFTLVDLSVIPKRFLKSVISTDPLVNKSMQCVRSVLKCALENYEERSESTCVSFKIGGNVISCCSLQQNALVKCPVNITFEMDVIQHRRDVFVGTGRKIYAYVNNIWYSKDVDFTQVRQPKPCITCSSCFEDHWYIGRKSDIREWEKEFWSSNYSRDNSFNFFNGLRSCSNCTKLMDKRRSDESCYNRCIGVGDSVYMLTMEYIIEYKVSTSVIAHHNVSIGLGNGFAVAASSECIYAVGGNGTKNMAVAFDVKSKLVTRLQRGLWSTSPPISFGRAIFDSGRLYVTDNHAKITEYYDLQEKIWKISNDRVILKRPTTSHFGDGLRFIEAGDN